MLSGWTKTVAVRAVRWTELVWQSSHLWEFSRTGKSRRQRDRVEPRFNGLCQASCIAGTSLHSGLRVRVELRLYPAGRTKTVSSVNRTARLRCCPGYRDSFSMCSWDPWVSVQLNLLTLRITFRLWFLISAPPKWAPTLQALDSYLNALRVHSLLLWICLNWFEHWDLFDCVLFILFQ